MYGRSVTRSNQETGLFGRVEDLGWLKYTVVNVGAVSHGVKLGDGRVKA